MIPLKVSSAPIGTWIATLFAPKRDFIISTTRKKSAPTVSSAKGGVAPVKYLRELRLAEATDYTVGQTLAADIFAEGELVDVVGTGKGKGFAGTIKRHNFSRGPETHGSKSHREPGSIGPMISGGGGKVFKGKKLPGQMGGGRVTVQRLSVVKVDAERNLLLIKGGIPGAKGSLVMVRNTVKPVK